MKRFKMSWTDMVKSNLSKNMLIAVLVLSNFISMIGWSQSRETTILLPWTLDDRMEVSVNRSSLSYRKAWALSVAELLGNVTPGNADFIVDHIDDILAPAAYRAVKSELAEQIKNIKEDSITLSFEPKDTVYEEETDKIFIYGEFQSVGPTGKPQKIMRTYEMQVAIRFGRPWVTRLSPYPGHPKTIQYLKTQGVAQVNRN